MICTLIIAAHMGGSVPQHQMLVAWAERSGCEVRIEGDCASICTMLLRVACITPEARLGFPRPKAINSQDERDWAWRMAQYLPKRMAA